MKTMKNSNERDEVNIGHNKRTFKGNNMFDDNICRVQENEAENTFRKNEFDTYSERRHSKVHFEKKIKSITWKMTKWQKYLDEFLSRAN